MKLLSLKHIPFVISSLCVCWIIGWSIYKSGKLPILLKKAEERVLTLRGTSSYGDPGKEW